MMVCVGSLFFSWLSIGSSLVHAGLILFKLANAKFSMATAGHSLLLNNSTNPNWFNTTHLQSTIPWHNQ
jgi:hypothetical protein